MWVADHEMTLEGLGTGVAPTSVRHRRRGVRAGKGFAWVRERLATTPGRLVLISISVIVGAVVFGAVATGAEQSRERAAKAARSQTELLLAQATSLYTSLSDANATVGTGLLSGGLETEASRQRYQRDLVVATNALSQLTREAGTAATASVALGTIADQLPVYSGLIETARANNRLGYPIGAAYLRGAATVMTSMLQAADHLYRTEAGRLDDDYRTGSATSTLITFAVASAIALILLVLAQWYVARISRRILNVPMVVATFAVAAVSVWGVIGLVNEQNALETAQRNGSDSVEALSAATVLLSRAQGDLSLALVSRGTDTRDPLDFKLVSGVLGRPGGVFAEIASLGRRTGTTAATMRADADYAAYQAQANQITNLEETGQTKAAIAGVQDASNISEQLSSDLGGQIGAAQARFKRSAADATSALDGLAFAIPLITVLAALLALVGLRQRINEYR
jgi:hypothetical protein